MEPIDLGGQVGQEQLQLGEKGEVVGGDVGMWATADIVVYKPVRVQGAQDTQHVQVRLRIENIVDDTLGREKGKICKYRKTCRQRRKGAFPPHSSSSALRFCVSTGDSTLYLVRNQVSRRVTSSDWSLQADRRVPEALVTATQLFISRHILIDYG